jgi:phage tail-like protein
MTTRKGEPSPSFRFKIEFRGGPGTSASFTECSGLQFEAETFDYPEGGVQSQVHRLPGRVKYSNIELKRGIAADGESLWRWVKKMVAGTVDPCNMTISLLNARGEFVREWTFRGAYPVKWSATTFSAEQSAIAIETLTIAHQGLLITDLG